MGGSGSYRCASVRGPLAPSCRSSPAWGAERTWRSRFDATRSRAEPANVLIADDHAPTRDDVRRALERGGGFTVSAEAGDASEAVQAALREQPDICLLDVCMPGSG